MSHIDPSGRARSGIAWAIIAWTSVAPCALAQQTGGPPPAPVVLGEARLETIEQWREVTGGLRAARRALLAAEDEGMVVEVTLDEGDRVDQGGVVARLRDTRARIDVARAEADVGAKRAIVAEREADADRAKRDTERMEEMHTLGGGSEKEMDEMRTALKAASARVAQANAELAGAEADLAWAKERLSYMTIAAPFAGRVVSKRTEVGQWVQRGDPVVEVVAMDQIEARLDVPEGLIDRLTAPDAVVQVRVTATGEVYRAPMTATIPDADPRSRLFPVRVRLDNPKGLLRPGMSVVGLVPTGSAAPTLTIPKDAILRNDAGEYVYFSEGGVAAVAPVQSLFAVDDRVAVRAPRLRPGAQVVTEGNERLFPGQPLAPLPPKASSAGPAPTPASEPR